LYLFEGVLLFNKLKLKDINNNNNNDLSNSLNNSDNSVVVKGGNRRGFYKGLVFFVKELKELTKRLTHINNSLLNTLCK
jgi:hypothetical protein